MLEEQLFGVLPLFWIVDDNKFSSMLTLLATLNRTIKITSVSNIQV